MHHPVIKEASNVHFQPHQIQKPLVYDSLKDVVTLIQTRISPNGLEINQRTSGNAGSVRMEQSSCRVILNMPMNEHTTLIKYSTSEPYSTTINIYRTGKG